MASEFSTQCDHLSDDVLSNDSALSITQIDSYQSLHKYPNMDQSEDKKHRGINGITKDAHRANVVKTQTFRNCEMVTVSTSASDELLEDAKIMRESSCNNVRMKESGVQTNSVIPDGLRENVEVLKGLNRKSANRIKMDRPIKMRSEMKIECPIRERQSLDYQSKCQTNERKAKRLSFFIRSRNSIGRHEKSEIWGIRTISIGWKNG